MISEGDQVPAITMKLSDGTSLDLARPGGLLLLYFYPKDDTPGCTREAQEFSARAADFAAAGAQIVGVSRDAMTKHAKFILKYGLYVALVADTDGAISEAFGTWVEKSLYGRRYMGLERASFLIDANGRVVRAWRKVKVAGHANEVLAAVRSA